jgi:hypothetical protein
MIMVIARAGYPLGVSSDCLANAALCVCTAIVAAYLALCARRERRAHNSAGHTVE